MIHVRPAGPVESLDLRSSGRGPIFSVSPPKKGQEPRFSAAQGPLTLSENDPVRDPRPRRVIQRKAKQTAALRSTPTGLSERLGPVIFPPLTERDYGASSARMSSLNHERPIVRVERYNLACSIEDRPGCADPLAGCQADRAYRSTSKKTVPQVAGLERPAPRTAGA